MGTILTHAALLERAPAPDPAMILAWWQQLKALDAADAWVAMIDHFDNESRRLWPADLVTRIEDMRSRWMAAHPGATEIPPGFGRADALPTPLQPQRQIGGR